MRRRDANDASALDSTADTRGPVVLALTVSLALHVAFMAAAAVPLFRARPPALIHVSLLSGNDNQEAGSSAGAFVGPAAPIQSADTAQVPRAPLLKRPAHPRPRVVAGGATDTQEQPSGVGPPDGEDTAGAERGLGGSATAMPAGSGSGAGAGAGHGNGFDPRTLCVYCPEPRYPLVARARGWQGTVEVALSVLADGSVDGASLGRSSGYPALDDAAIAVARHSRFRLPRQAGVSAPLRGRMEYRFVLSGG